MDMTLYNFFEFVQLLTRRPLMRGMKLFFYALLLPVLVSSLHATIIRVPRDSDTIQGGIHLASDGDEVVVSPGTYHEHNINFLGKRITVRSTDPDDWNVVHGTIVDGQGMGTIFLLVNGESSESVLTGFTITGGQGDSNFYSIWAGGIACENSRPTISNNLIYGNISAPYDSVGTDSVNVGGGGISAYLASPTIVNNQIVFNSGLNGGGIYCRGLPSQQIVPTIEDNLIAFNSIDIFDRNGHGGGIYCEEASTTISNNFIHDNTGGAIYCLETYTDISNNIISGNENPYGGNDLHNAGGIDFKHSEGQINYNTISRNGGLYGGGIDCSSSSPDIGYNTITENWTGGFTSLDRAGAGITMNNSSPWIHGNSITDNFARYGRGGGIYCGRSSSPIIEHNTISRNTGDNARGGGIAVEGGGAKIRYNYITENEVGWGGGIYTEDDYFTGEDFYGSISNNTINDNVGGGIYCSTGSVPVVNDNYLSGNRGGGIVCWDAKPVIILNEITLNTIRDSGGGIKCLYGSNPIIGNNNIYENESDEDGGGISCEHESNPLILNNRIYSNQSGNGGGGIACLDSSRPLISGNRIEFNSTQNWGGGIYSNDSSPRILNNFIFENIVQGFNDSDGGGGIESRLSTPTIEGNFIEYNRARQGGGIRLMSQSEPTLITQNVITGNEAIEGGGIFTFFSSPEITNTIISANLAEAGGGIYSTFYSEPVLDYSTIVENESDFGEGGGLYINGYSHVKVYNTIFWDNTDGTGYEISLNNTSGLYMNYSDLEGGPYAVDECGDCVAGLGGAMIFDDPQFADDSYLLQYGSPCIDAGEFTNYDECHPTGWGDLLSDIGAYGGEGNCWFEERGIGLVIFPDRVPIVRRGESFQFSFFVMNNTNESVETKLSLWLMDETNTEWLIPEGWLFYDNPLQLDEIYPHKYENIIGDVYQVPSDMPTGTYQLIGRLGESISPGEFGEGGEFSLEFEVIE
jgi:parallel beta-helix repeat protein